MHKKLTALLRGKIIKSVDLDRDSAWDGKGGWTFKFLDGSSIRLMMSPTSMLSEYTQDYGALDITYIHRDGHEEDLFTY